MAHGHFPEIDPQELDRRFEMDGGTRKWISIFIGVGLLLLILGIVLGITSEGKHKSAGHGGGHHSSAYVVPNTNNPAHLVNKDHQTQAPDAHGQEHKAGGHHEEAHGGGGGHAHVHEPIWVTRLLAGLIANSFLFMGASILFVFFLALKVAANAGWHVQLMRIAEAYGHFFPVGAILLLLIFLGAGSWLYHWSAPGAMETDALLKSKEWWLNKPFFIVRTVLFTGLWIAFFMFFRNTSRAEDKQGGIKIFQKRIPMAAIFLIIFALTFSAMAWDWIMSIEAHWFSTMFGVRMFASSWVSALAIMTITTIYLKSKGYLKYINAAHFHDLGKFIFAFSIFWTYIWFSEYMLIWYSNIPEEGIYFYKRFEMYPVLFFANFGINFLVPFLILLHKSNMRHVPTIGFVAFVALFGKFLDVYLCVAPGTVGEYGGLGLMEIGMFMTFLGVFFASGAYFLTKASLVPKNHPYLKESLWHIYH